MSLLSNRGFNVRLAPRDEKEKVTPEERYANTNHGIETAQAYSEIVQDFVAGVGGTIVICTVTIVAAKFASEFLKIGLSAVTNRK